MTMQQTIKGMLLASLALIHVCASATDYMSLFHQGNEQYRAKQYHDAINSYTKAVALNSDEASLYFNIGLCQYHLKNMTQALSFFRQTLTYNYSLTKARFYIATILSDTPEYQEAIEQYQEVIKEEPYTIDAYLGLARLLCQKSRFSESAAFYKRAIILQPENSTLLLELGNALNMNNEVEEALEIYHKLYDITHNSQVEYNIAYTLKKLGRVHEAIPHYKKVLSENPDYTEAHFGLGLSYLLIGNLKEGWAEYEWRFKRSHNENHMAHLTKPLWDGSNCAGKTVLLHAEQGIGDTFQFIRYAKILHDAGARVIFACPNAVFTLLKLCPYIDDVVLLNGSIPYYDVHAPLLSLPYLMDTTLETIPTPIPYLFAQATLIEEWCKKLNADKKVKIGICWQGNPNYQTHFLRVAVAAKSMNVNSFAPFSEVPHVSVYSLQRETGTDQLKAIVPEFPLITYGPEFDRDNGRFMDTAALIKNLDLVITIDTSICHLAGGLGVPVWLMLPNPADWRWLLDRNDTPWYPTMRLFRQPAPGDWDSVINEVKKELEQLINYY